MGTPQPSNIWYFANCEFDQTRRELRVAGQPVPLEPKPMELLLCLLEHGNAAVSKDRLLDRVWPGRVVSETVLARTVMKLRKALEDADQQIVATAHGYGYRMAVPVEKPAGGRIPGAAPRTAHAPESRWRAALLIAAAAVLSVAAIMTWNRLGRATNARLALLPVQVEAGAAPQWMDLGLMSLLENKLSHEFDVLPAGRVMSTLEAAPQKTVADRIALLRRNYGPLQVLVSSLAAQGEGVRLTYALHRPNRNTLTGSLDAAGAVQAGNLLYRRLRRALGASGRAQSRTPLAEELYAHGRAANLRGNARAARDYLAAALREDPGMAWARYELALAQRQLGATEEAEAAFEKLISQHGGDPELVMSAHNALAIQLWRDGRLDLAEPHLRQARALAEDHEFAYKLPALLLNLGILHSSRGQFDKAQDYYHRALSKARELGNRNLEAKIYNSLGVLAWRQGDVDRSYTEHARALEIRRKINVPGDLAASLNNLATVALARGRWTEAQKLLEEAYALRLRLGDIAGLASTAGNLARLAILQGRYSDAHELIRRSERRAQAAGYAKVQAEARVLYGKLAERRGDYAKARSHYRAAIEHYQSIGRDYRTDALRIAAAMLPGGDPVKDRALAEAILQRDELTPDLEADALLLYARLLAPREPKAAEQAWQRSLALADRLGDRGLGVKISLTYAEYLIGRQRLDEAAPLLARLGAWPEYAPALAIQARYWRARGDLKRALAYQRRAREAAHEAWSAEDQARLATLEDAFLAASE